VDRIEPVRVYRTLLYRAFLVGRGFDARLKRQPERDMLAWQGLQQALFNVSGPSFRLLFDVDDPLNLVADRDGWQCFMLYHKAFTDEGRDENGWTYIDKLNSDLEGNWGAQHDEVEARALCETRLSPVHARWDLHWKAFKEAVKECKRLPGGFNELLNSGWSPPKGKNPLEGIDLTRKNSKTGV